MNHKRMVRVQRILKALSEITQERGATLEEERNAKRRMQEISEKYIVGPNALREYFKEYYTAPISKDWL